MHVYTLDDPSMDHLECRRSMNMLPLWFTALLADFWRESAPIVIAGGFPSWAMGYTTQYTDIDVFISKQILTLFIRRIKQQTNNMGHLVCIFSTASLFPQSPHQRTVLIFFVLRLFMRNIQLTTQIASPFSTSGSELLKLTYRYTVQLFLC